MGKIPAMSASAERLRVGVYADLVYRRHGGDLSTDRAFILFVCGLAERADELVLFGRLSPHAAPAPYVIPAGIRHIAFPHYSSVKDLGGVVRSLRGSVRTFRGALPELDVVWLFGPYPVSVVLALVARRAGVPVVLGVRQDFPEYVRNRLPSSRWAWAVPVARGLELVFRLLARRAPAIVVGDALAGRYSWGPAPVLATGFSLIRERDVVSEEAALGRSWDGPVRLITVGRIDAEKNPLLLPEILLRLRERGRPANLVLVGTGPLERALRKRAAELGVSDALELRGYVPAGEELWQLYRAADAFLHVSLTEGLPQVLFEARAAGLPVVATDVGGVRAALEGGEGGLLVPPRDAGAAADAVERLAADPAIRERLVRRGLAEARKQTTDVQLDEIARLLRGAAASNSR